MRTAPALATITAAAVMSVTLVAAPARADDTTVTTFAELSTTAALSLDAPMTAILGADISAPDSSVQLNGGSVLTIDLNGHDLTIASVTLGVASTVTITDTSGGDPGTLTADSSDTAGAAGIGTAGAHLTITGQADVSATGGAGAPGIGATTEGPGGTITIRGDSTVFAVGGAGGAGIGVYGLDDSDVSDTSTITELLVDGNAHVLAFAGVNGAGIGGGATDNSGLMTFAGSSETAAIGSDTGAGIGGGQNGSGGDVRILEDAHVLAQGSTSVAAIGGGLGDESVFGRLTVDGRLTMPAGSYLTIPSWETVKGVGAIDGDGAIINNGSMTLLDENVTVPNVTGHNYLVTYALDGGTLTPPRASQRVFATSFANAELDFPVPTKTGYVVNGWKKSNGSTFTASTVITAPITITAKWLAYQSSVPAPTISGTLAVGNGLSASITGWAPGTQFDAQWYRSGKAISGATENYYTLVAADRGKTMSVAYTGVLDGYVTVTKKSASTKAIGYGTLVAGIPSITGAELLVGKVLTADPGDWLEGSTFSYQWYIDGVPVSKATKSTWTVTSTALGRFVDVRVTGSAPGYSSAYAMASTDQFMQVGYFGSQATIDITGTVQTGKKLTAVLGSWTVKPTTIGYQWFADGAAIPGATKSTYTIPTSRLGSQLSVRITATKAGYASLRYATGPTLPVLGTLKGSTPKIAGTLTTGSTVTANPGTWTAGTTFVYDWYWVKAGVTTFAAEHLDPTYTIPTGNPALVGATLKVKVTGSLVGYQDLSYWSALTKKVAN
jgi:uncharacterized repeat protein (TIGR02543 family)